MATKESSWIRTFSGQNFDPLNPRISKIDLMDIAHSLSNICRFNGHTSEFYCVAEHSVLVSEHLESKGFNEEYQFSGLMHDVSEAYICDIARPVKINIQGYAEYEDRIMARISTKFKLQVNYDDPAIKESDRILCSTEARDLMGDPQDWDFRKGIPLWDRKIVPCTPVEAKEMFLNRFNKLNKSRSSNAVR